MGGLGRKGGNAAQALDEVEGRPLAHEKRPDGGADGGQHLPVVHLRAVRAEKLHRGQRLDALKHAREGLHSGQDERFLGHQLGATARRGGDERHRGDVPGRAEVLVQSEVNQPVEGVHAEAAAPLRKAG
jgi:hypothetical protein